MFVIRTTDLKKTLWKNGLGLSTKLLSHPTESGVSNFDWRVSLAEINAPCEFSLFPGCDRALVILSDDGLILNREKIQPLRVALFPGETITRAAHRQAVEDVIELAAPTRKAVEDARCSARSLHDRRRHRT